MTLELSLSVFIDSEGAQYPVISSLVVCMYNIRIVFKGSKCGITFADISPSILLFVFQDKVEVNGSPPLLASNDADVCCGGSGGQNSAVGWQDFVLEALGEKAFLAFPRACLCFLALHPTSL